MRHKSILTHFKAKTNKIINQASKTQYNAIMERKILFRGKRLDNGQWAQGCLVCGTFKAYIYPYLDIEGGTTGAEVDTETVGQYTGKDDSDGRMIFEGDILKGEYFGESVPCKVAWSEDGWDCTTAHGEGATLHCASSFGAVVAGNIHDNSELMDYDECL